MSRDGRPSPEVSLPDAAAPLPDDPAILQQMIRELLEVLRQSRNENEQLQHASISSCAASTAPARNDSTRISRS
jgi:hypothetical protein